MPRPPRIEYDAGVYHAGIVGNAGELLCRTELDRDLLVMTTVRAAARFRWIVHAYCVMSTHAHWVLETRDRTLSRGMQWLGGVYAQGYNRRHGRRGCLVEDRFWSRVVFTDLDYLGTCAYVFGNPVRAGLCEDVRDWRWSGGRAFEALPKKGMSEGLTLGAAEKDGATRPPPRASP